MRKLIWINVAYVAAFVGMGLLEMTGVTTFHGALPHWGKWVWLFALAGGNLVIHVAMMRRVKWVEDHFSPVDRSYHV